MSGIFGYQELRESQLPCTFFSASSISLVVKSPRLFIFSTSKATPVRLGALICTPNPGVDPQITVEVICDQDHFGYKWETRLSNLEQNSQSWNIKPNSPCGLDPFQMQIVVTINGERKVCICVFNLDF